MTGEAASQVVVLSDCKGQCLWRSAREVVHETKLLAVRQCKLLKQALSANLHAHSGALIKRLT